jgi:hypothetical protein
MNSDYQKIEHFCTLFDHKFLPMGLNLHASLVQHSQSFNLWILCIDELVEQQLKQINLPSVTLIPVADIETESLLKVKTERSRGEYCWTLTPFIFSAVFERHPDVERLTYLDADLFFFRDPKILLDEFTESDRDVLVTEHAYAPKYEQSQVAGKFCVQFLTFRNTNTAYEVISWWQRKCLNWCFARLENGKLGDQKYLDVWPDIFPGRIWILQQKENTLAPWNVKYFYNYLDESFRPVFFHFHNFRIVSKTKILLYIHYNVGQKAKKLYMPYIHSLQKNLSLMNENGFPIPTMSFSRKHNNLSLLRHLKYIFLQRIAFIEL